MQQNEPTSRTYQLRLIDDFYHICIADCLMPSGEDISASRLDRQDITYRAGEAPRMVSFVVARNYEVPVDVDVRNNPPDEDYTGWNYVVEGSLEVPSGCVDIAGCTSELKAAPHIRLTPGTYRVRVYSGGLHTVSADRRRGSDHYRVVLWAAPVGEPLTLFCDGYGERLRTWVGG